MRPPDRPCGIVDEVGTEPVKEVLQAFEEPLPNEGRNGIKVGLYGGLIDLASLPLLQMAGHIAFDGQQLFCKLDEGAWAETAEIVSTEVSDIHEALRL